MIAVTCDPYEVLFEGIRSFPLMMMDTTTDNACIRSIQFCLFVILLTFGVSTVTKNYSQVDKLWSIVPAVYAWLAVCDLRTFIMALLATVWAIRLTWNFHRRGGFKWPPWKGDEDYRWKILQDGFLVPALSNPVVWSIFNLVFISAYQMTLLFLISTPSLISWSSAMSPSCHNDNSNNNASSSFKVFGLDGIATILILFFIGIETIADNQQYRFQTEKYRRQKLEEKEKIDQEKTSLLTDDYTDGYLHSHGLFTIVRKPNYLAEQSIWICYYLFSIAATNHVFNLSMIGWVLLCLLFQGSAKFTEDITLTKYSSYKEYQNKVPLFIPSFSSLFRINPSIFK